MTEQDLAFLEANIINFEAVALGFTRNIDRDVLEEYAVIYRKYLNKDFILNSWCGNCVFDMLKRLSAHYEGLKYIAKLNQPKPNDVQTKNLRSRK
jgi:hypothetical protein